MESVAPANVNELCRICFKIKDGSHTLLIQRDNCSLHDTLVNIAKLNYDVNDEGPKTICMQCFAEFNGFIRFLDKCKRSNEIFLQFKHNLSDTSNDECCNNFSLSDTDGKTKVESLHNISISERENFKQVVSNERAKATSVCHTCQLCQKVFTRKFNYNLHLKRHSGEREWACPQCGAASDTRARARRHCAPRARRACPAPACGKTYTSLANLRTHLRKHSGERPFACAQCGAAFRSSGCLAEHARSHSGAKPYLCWTCGRRFATNKLAAHMRTHAPPAHACATCARPFRSERALRLHARTHGAGGGGARKHACPRCPARYAHSQSLNKHLRKRHPLTTSGAITESSEVVRK